MATTSSIFVCVKNTVITHFYMTGYASDTGFDDPFRFHLYSALPADGDSANTTTFLWQTDRITPSVSGRNVVYDTVVDNVTVDKNQRLYLFYKKETTSANQDLYFSAQISGHYTK